MMQQARELWDRLPARVKIAAHGAWSAAVGGAFTALVAWASSPPPHNIGDVWPLVVTGAVAAVGLYFGYSPVPKYRFERAVEKGEMTDRRVDAESVDRKEDDK